LGIGENVVAKQRKRFVSKQTNKQTQKQQTVEKEKQNRRNNDQINPQERKLNKPIANPEFFAYNQNKFDAEASE
jgi:hypothetical protein